MRQGGLPVPEDSVVYEAPDEADLPAPAARVVPGAPARARGTRPPPSAAPSGRAAFAEVTARGRVVPMITKVAPRARADGVALDDHDIEEFLVASAKFSVSPSVREANVLIHTKKQLELLLESLSGGTRIEKLTVKAADYALGKIRVEDWTFVAVGNPALASLDLGNFEIMSGANVPLPSSLRSLTLRNCVLSDVDALLEEAGAVGVQNLAFVYTDLFREYPYPIIPDFATILRHIPDARALVLRGCALAQAWAGDGGDFQGESLESLELDGSLPVAELERLFYALAQCPRIAHFAIKRVADGPALVRAVAGLAYLMALRPLHSLHFHAVTLSRATASTIVSVCVGHSQLTEFSLGGADLGFQMTALEMAEMFAKLTFVRRLFLDHLTLGTAAVNAILNAAADMPRLRELHFGDAAQNTETDRLLVRLFERNRSVTHVMLARAPAESALAQLRGLAKTGRDIHVTGFTRHPRPVAARPRQIR